MKMVPFPSDGPVRALVCNEHTLVFSPTDSPVATSVGDHFVDGFSVISGTAGKRSLTD